jgi:competence protein ComEA
MQFFSFTPQETKALLFLLAALLVGSGITLYKRSHPRFAPGLILEQKRVDAADQDRSGLNEEQQGAKININQATADQLQLLPGIGPALSKRIVECREANGRFERIEDLMQVRGIGPKTFERMRDCLTVE